VQLRGGQAPHRPLAWIAGDGAEFGQHPARRVQGQGVLVDSAPPGILPRHRPLLDPQVGVVGFQPAQVPLLGPPQQPQPLGRLISLPGGRPQRLLGQHQPLPDGGQLPPTAPAPGQGRDLVGGGLLVGVGVLAGLFGLGRPVGGQPQLPKAIRRTLGAQLGEPVAFDA
jgi:hypothetical protein